MTDQPTGPELAEAEPPCTNAMLAAHRQSLVDRRWSPRTLTGNELAALIARIDAAETRIAELERRIAMAVVFQVREDRRVAWCLGRWHVTRPVRRDNMLWDDLGDYDSLDAALAAAAGGPAPTEGIHRYSEEEQA